jgi:hypothetical protein
MFHSEKADTFRNALQATPDCDKCRARIAAAAFTLGIERTGGLGVPGHRLGDCEPDRWAVRPVVDSCQSHARLLLGSLGWISSKCKL